MKLSAARPLVGVLTLCVIAAVVAFSVQMFRGGFTASVPVTVISSRAGLVMDPEAKVKLHGAQVGKVAAIDPTSDGQAAIRLALDPDALDLIPSNVLVQVASTTVFGAKYVDLLPPPHPTFQRLRPGQVLSVEHVTVEVNTVFQQLVAVLSKIDPVKLNETLGVVSSALSGRGAKFGQSLTDLDTLLSNLDPSLGNLNHELSTAPAVFSAFADAAPDLLRTARAGGDLSTMIVETQRDLDRLLINAIGVADTGNEFLTTNRQAIADTLHLFLPTTDLTNQYNQALTCGLAGMAPLATAPPLPVPGVLLLDSFYLGVERYRYPQNLPKVAATGGPQCSGLPNVGFQQRPPFVVTDVDANPAQYGNQGILLNSDGLKQMLFGPIDGPPRNTAQIGQPG